MSSDQRDATEPVRLLFEMTREDNPRLYDDLVRFNKGTKRVNRLRFLAHEGLLVQNWLAAPGVALPARPGHATEPRVESSAARHTNQAFEAPNVPEKS